jgi:hypothetical protein
MTPEKKDFKGKKVLVTGGLGFIGSNLSIRLIELGAEVTIVDNMMPRLGGNLFNVKEVVNRIHIACFECRPDCRRADHETVLDQRRRLLDLEPLLPPNLRQRCRVALTPSSKREIRPDVSNFRRNLLLGHGTILLSFYLGNVSYHCSLGHLPGDSTPTAKLT